MSAGRFWQQVIDSASPPVFLPDVGTFFNQDMALAEALIQQVVDAGVDFVKGEILHTPDICLPSNANARYLDPQGQVVVENYRQLIERKVMPLESYRKLFSEIDTGSVGLVFSVYDIEGADFAMELGSSALKIASNNIVHAPLIRHCARSGLPLIIDTGSSSFEEVRRALHWAGDAGAERIVIEYSPPAPPAPLSEHNLSVIRRLHEFGLPVGLSDHHHGEDALYLATALGYRVLEKGISPGTELSEQDVYHALSAGRLSSVLAGVTRIHQLIGRPEDAYPEPQERRISRMGLVAAWSLQAGERLTLENVRFAFPTLGIPVEDWDRVENAALRVAVGSGDVIRWEDLDV